MNMHKAEPTYLQPPSLAGLAAWHGGEPVQPAWISSSLLESLTPFDAKSMASELELAEAKYACDTQFSMVSEMEYSQSECDNALNWKYGQYGGIEIDCTLG